MKTVLLLTILLLIFLPAHAQNNANNSPKSAGKLEEDKIREILFLSLFEKWQNPTIKDLEIYFVSVDWKKKKNPSKNLLEKLQRKYKQVRQITDSTEDSEEKIIERNTRKKGIIFSVSKINWMNNNEVKVNAGSYLGNMASDGCLYTLKHETKGWIIVSEEQCFIS